MKKKHKNGTGPNGRAISGRSGTEVPPPMFDTNHPASRAWLQKNRKSSYRQRYPDDVYLLIFVAGLDEWLGSTEILALFPRFPKDKIRRVRRLTYSKRINDHIRSALPAEIAQPQEWQRYLPMDKARSNTPIAATKRNKRQAPPLDELADRLDKLRIDGLTTLRWWN